MTDRNIVHDERMRRNTSNNRWELHFRFPCGRWLGRDVEDGSTERLLVAAPTHDADAKSSAPAPPTSSSSSSANGNVNHRVLARFLPSVDCFHLVPPSFAQFCQILPNFTEFYTVYLVISSSPVFPAGQSIFNFFYPVLTSLIWFWLV